MSKLSTRHHYIPVFYIKNFYDDKGQIYINDKTNDSNYTNIEVKVPKKIFFEWGRNNYTFNGELNDAIEKMYGILDSDLSKILNRLVTNEALQGNGMQVETLRKLIFWVTL